MRLPSTERLQNLKLLLEVLLLFMMVLLVGVLFFKNPSRAMKHGLDIK